MHSYILIVNGSVSVFARKTESTSDPTAADTTSLRNKRCTLLSPVSLLLSSQMQFCPQLRASAVQSAELDVAQAQQNPSQNSLVACPQMLLQFITTTLIHSFPVTTAIHTKLTVSVLTNQKVRSTRPRPYCHCWIITKAIKILQLKTVCLLCMCGWGKWVIYRGSCKCSQIYSVVYHSHWVTGRACSQ